MKARRRVAAAIIVFVSLMTVVSLSGLTLFTSPAPQPKESSRQEPSMSTVSLTTADGMRIAADLYTIPSPRAWIVYLHMMPATKESWAGIAPAFAAQGYEGLAIDLRGHGASEGGPGGYKKFSDADHKKSIADVDAAVAYLVSERGAAPRQIFFIGASIGANLALQYLGTHADAPKAVLLSPGLNYRGIATEPFARELHAGQATLLVASRDDGAAAEEAATLAGLMPNQAIKQVKIYDTAGHGTTMLSRGPDLAQLIFQFINSW